MNTCPICRSTQARFYRHTRLRCLNCNLIYDPNAQNSTVSLGIYNRDYFCGKVYRDYPGEAQSRIKNFKDKLELMDEYLPSTGQVLDLGCALGYFLRVMETKGWDTWGVDLSSYAVQEARKDINGSVVQGDLREAEFPEGYFDLVALWDTLEHLAAPVEVLKEVRRIVKPDGLLLIETLNIGSLTAKLLGRKWPLYAPPYHLVYYSTETLTKLLEASGFTPGPFIPIQTYFPHPCGFVTWRYFRYRHLRQFIGRWFNDVVLCTARPRPG